VVYRMKIDDIGMGIGDVIRYELKKACDGAVKERVALKIVEHLYIKTRKYSMMCHHTIRLREFNKLCNQVVSMGRVKDIVNNYYSNNGRLIKNE